MAVKFYKHYITNGHVKARCWYSLDNHCDNRKCVTIWSKEYNNALGKVFADTGAEYQNDTDSQSDYFDKGRVVLFEGDVLYTEARAAVEAVLAWEQEQRTKRAAAKTARWNAKYGVAA